MWINKYLASEGYTTRRGADALVKTKKVFINGRLAVATDKVVPGDKIEVRGFKVPVYHYFAYNKPRGEETDMSFKGIFPLGRLDKDSQGLILLTSDGRVTDRLLNPNYEHEKEYEVKVDKDLKPSFKTKMERGVDIEGYLTKKCRVSIIAPTKFKVVLNEGKKHQIRRMCAALGYAVRDLKRTRVMNIKLGILKSGERRELVGEELKKFLSALGL